MKEGLHWQGKISQEPKLRDGQKLELSPQLITFNKIDRATHVEDLGFARGVLLQVFFCDAATNEAHGTATMVSAGVAITASHVFEPLMETLQSGAKWSLCIGATDEGLTLWEVRTVTAMENTDLTILGLKLRSEIPDADEIWRIQSTYVTTRLPKISEVVSIVGIRPRDPAYLIEDAIEDEIIVSQGEVKQLFTKARDRIFLPFPCFEIDCPAWGAMSGGPIFSSSGHLIGLLSSSFTSEDPLAGPAYGSLLFPILPHPFNGGWPANLVDGSRGLIDVSRSFARIEQPEAFQKDEATGDYRYHSW